MAKHDSEDLEALKADIDKLRSELTDLAQKFIDTGKDKAQSLVFVKYLEEGKKLAEDSFYKVVGRLSFAISWITNFFNPYMEFLRVFPRSYVTYYNIGMPKKVAK